MTFEIPCLAELMEYAHARTGGLTDFGGRDYEPGLEALVEAIRTAPDLSESGKAIFTHLTVTALAKRLEITSFIERHPEVLDIPIDDPVFITGLPRSGTTLAHRLLALGASKRPLLFWELYSPVPMTDEADLGVGRRIAAAEEICQVLASERHIHEYTARGPHECTWLLLNSFACQAFGCVFHVPAYDRWLYSQDLVSQYAFYRKQLQVLLWQRQGRLVLKSPNHMANLPALFKAFPNARVIHLHRDVAEVIPSCCSMYAAKRTKTMSPVDKRLVSEVVTHRCVSLLERAASALGSTSVDKRRVMHVSYSDLMRDPAGTIERINTFAGFDVSENDRNLVARYLADNPQHKHGKHRYSADEYGLCRGSIERVRELAAAHAPQ